MASYEPVSEVSLLGQPKPQVQPKAVSGSHSDWLLAAGIPESDWAVAEILVQHESSWNPTAKNPRSTAYGLMQFLDSTWAGVGCAKTSDPIEQLRCGDRYVRNRYGSWQGAWSFWQSHRWY